MLPLPEDEVSMGLIGILFTAAYWFIFGVMMLVGAGIVLSMVVWAIIGALTLGRR